MKRRIPVFFIVLFMSAAVFGQAKKPILASDLMKLATANQLQISPDGNKAIMVVSRKAVKNENDYYYTRHLYLLDLAGTTEPTQLTYGDKSDGQPQWSPDGKQILFVRNDGERSQLWLLPLSGGEAHAITKSEYGAGNPRWSPDGKKILYSASIPFSKIEGKTPWTFERPGRALGDEPNFKGMKADERKKVSNSPDGSLEEVRAWLAKNSSESNPRVLTRQDFQGEQNLSPDESFSHLFVKTVNSDDKDVQLTQGFQDFGGGEWSPDGKTIICQSRVYKIHPDREQDNDLWVIDVASKTSKEFLTWPGYSISNPTFSPDGTTISFSATNIENRHSTQNQLAVISFAGGKPTLITASLDRDAGNVIWSADSKTIYFSAQSEGDILVYSTPAKGGAITKILGGNDDGVNDFDIRAGKIVYALTETKKPWEIYLYNFKDKTSRQLTRLNDDWMKDKAVSVPKEYWVTRPDGTKIQYWVMEPIGKKDGVKYPVIL